MIYIQSIYKTKKNLSWKVKKSRGCHFCSRLLAILTICSLKKHDKKFYKKSMVPEINPNVFTKTKTWNSVLKCAIGFRLSGSSTFFYFWINIGFLLHNLRTSQIIFWCVIGVSFLQILLYTNTVKSCSANRDITKSWIKRFFQSRAEFLINSCNFNGYKRFGNKNCTGIMNWFGVP